MALNAIDTKIERAITTINVGEEHQLMFCGHLLAFRGRADTYLNKNQSAVSLPCLIQFIEDADTILPNGDTDKNINFYLFNTIEAVYTNPEKVRAVHDKLDEVIYQFFRNLQEEGLMPRFTGQRERLIEQIPSAYDAGILFTLTIRVDARC